MLCLQQVRDGLAVFVYVFSSRLSYLSFSNALSLGRRLDMTEILWIRP